MYFNTMGLIAPPIIENFKYFLLNKINRVFEKYFGEIRSVIRQFVMFLCIF